jgi:hypothetical protein
VIYLSGAIDPRIPQLEKIGYMLTPRHDLTNHIRNTADLSDTPWAADTGMFSHPESFALENYLAWLSNKPTDTNLFATAPDCMGDASATLQLAIPAFNPIRDLGFRVGFVAQDGQEVLPVPWSDFDCLFLGGTTAWKLSEAAYRLSEEAQRRQPRLQESSGEQPEPDGEEARLF